MSNEYRNNHYVPQWYQKRFIPSDKTERALYHLELKPRAWIDPRGKIHQIDPLKHQGTRLCFVEEDLYTQQFGSSLSTRIEKEFFGTIDRNGKKAIEYFNDFEHPSINHSAYQNMMLFMSTQKLRTPKGLEWISQNAGTQNHTLTLDRMLRLRRLHCAIWTESVWQIADATNSPTKFIISDHPVTIYNRQCGPRHRMCRGWNDPEIWLQGSHTIFPLSRNKILILTNLSWVRNPYQSALNLRPNPNPMRSAMFKYTEIQTHRFLTEEEVRQINFIIKSRAYKFIAAGEEEWLYPEKHVSKSDWPTYGNGYLLMPDPRPLALGGEIYVGHSDGTSSAYDEYGRTPIDESFSRETRTRSEQASFYRFKGEFARLFGPFRRGRSFNALRLDNERDSDEYHAHNLSLENNPPS